MDDSRDTVALGEEPRADEETSLAIEDGDEASAGTADAGDPADDADDGPRNEGAEVEALEEEGEDDVASETSTRTGPGADLSDDELLRRLTALVFASPDPLSLPRLVELLERPPRARVRSALEELERRFEAAGLPLQVRAIRGGHLLMTTPDVAETLARLAKGRTVERVSPAALETLAVIAYRQPVTKAEIESIRGVQAGPVLRSLVDRGLVKVVGRADVPGHPLQYGTTSEFLDRFGLNGLDDLPRDSELARG